ncbi:MAG: hypothetical protein EHM60_04875 [Lysobacterales bacterium]|nr:MAG: hypothetical protein EHM60_04875 [Xanthomonadales bacterium]
MRPLTVLTGIVLGSAAATTFGLFATLVVFVVLAGENPGFRAELPMLGIYLGVFVALTTVAGISFVGLARERPWRRWAQLVLWGTLAALAAFYWSTRP